jgi:hypothetical protein
MSCTINSILDKAQYNAKQVIEKNSKSYKEVRPGVYEARVKNNMSLNRLYERAAAVQNAVSNWAEKKYGEKFKFGWVKIDRSSSVKMTLNLNVPPNLVKAIEVKLGLTTLEAANIDLKTRREAKEVSYDPFLEAQEFQSDEDFYKEVNEVFNIKDVNQSDVRSEFGYKQNKEFDYDGTTDTQIQITDAELYQLLNSDNIC